MQFKFQPKKRHVLFTLSLWGRVYSQHYKILYRRLLPFHHSLSAFVFQQACWHSPSHLAQSFCKQDLAVSRVTETSSFPPLRVLQRKELRFCPWMYRIEMLISKNTVDGRFQKKIIPGPPQKSWRLFFLVHLKHCRTLWQAAKNVEKNPNTKITVLVERLWLKKLQQSHEAQWICDGGCLDDIVEGAPKTNPWKQCPCVISLIFKKACNISQKDLRT